MNKKLVAYFSASGRTAKLAKTLADTAGADLYEIKPMEPYTSADLNWQNKNSRSSVEMNHKSSRPAVANRVENISGYDIIFVGFPIWWYIAPTIINTFLEQYDLSGKIIIPFATSGGSEMGEMNKYLEPSCKGAVLKEGKKFSPDVSGKELSVWVANLNIE